MQIISKTVLAQIPQTRLLKFVIEARLIAASAQPGQFVMLMVASNGERIPLTIVDADKHSGQISLIVQEVGYTTRLLGQLNPGDKLYSLAGPLGTPTKIKKYGKVIIIGGGVGIAECYPIARALTAAGNNVETILGARSKELVILADQMRECSNKLHILTQDGSLGEQGLVTDCLTRLLNEGNDYQLVYTVGPLAMMAAVANLTKPYKIKTLVCLNALMLDGTGMCGSCRLTVGNENKFCCVDGPDFDGHQVDFNELAIRQQRFVAQEQHICKCK